MRWSIVVVSLLLAACGSTPAPITTGPTPTGFYRVKAGDTLYRIAKNNGQSVSDLVRWNNLAKAEDIDVGQLLRVTSPDGVSTKATPKATARPNAPVVNNDSTPVSAISLVWPAQGKLLYSYAPPRVKGIGIGGAAGDSIVAAADGKVLYAGDGIRGYGLLLIIQHSNGYITAYAHNQKLLVKEGAQVKQSQAVATMGQTGTDEVKLHFEVRFKGQTINPASVLPKK
ncbi:MULTISPECIES: peptidoglycan DD-metalloendopeptidase family protein [Deefgea]|uniref:Peptidoglycan DD-metalloendopeptidase family protein n=1 Tax=Deefgea chitinilytica TaxID=570276 RepID=A0ABS2CDD3_9NEIS|nr:MULTISPECIES: peptidoglycan DD-metalloendopeptidase family protein [Deefgea]MBM5571386.1 peptidoglycan DD-metalloendopeptidase family protein [Deefgea chitinilytica]MBM9888619.1 peptidoglycan DD-metalloendopeptidase family protein [Deefgea sp. CFH1-16]